MSSNTSNGAQTPGAETQQPADGAPVHPLVGSVRDAITIEALKVDALQDLEDFIRASKMEDLEANILRAKFNAHIQYFDVISQPAMLRESLTRYYMNNIDDPAYITFMRMLEELQDLCRVQCRYYDAATEAMKKLANDEGSGLEKGARHVLMSHAEERGHNGELQRHYANCMQCGGVRAVGHRYQILETEMMQEVSGDTDMGPRELLSRDV